MDTNGFQEMCKFPLHMLAGTGLTTPADRVEETDDDGDLLTFTPRRDPTRVVSFGPSTWI